jgi:RNA polymerase sigma-70 factor (ECF subfamily)
MQTKPFMELIEPNLRPLKRFVATAMRNPGDVDDIVQQTVLKAFVHVDQFRYDAQFNTWLRAIAMNEIRQFHRERLRHALVQTDDEEHTFEIPDGRESALSAWERKESAQTLRRAIARLPRTYQAVIELRYLSGLSVAETARRLSVGIGAVKTRLHRARRQLREAFLVESQATAQVRAA